MPKLNLRIPLRRDPNRPTLKQRAATLKATAARVLRRERPETDAEAIARLSASHIGFMPYPTHNPAGIIAIKYGLRAEADRLLSIAHEEFARLYALQSEGLDEPGREMVAARLRRRLRIDALTMAADPEGDAHEGGTHADLTMMTGGVVDDDGRVTFCDASGRVLRKPVADWIRLTASRLHHQAQREMARQINGSDLDQEEMQTLARELRRALRLDALNILAFRPGTACDLAEAAEADAFSGPIPTPDFTGWGPVSPDLLQAMEAHREARQLMLNDPDESDERTERGVARVDALAQAIRDVPARSAADLRCKMVYLWPGNLEGEEVSAGFAATFTAFKQDVERLAAPAPETAAGADTSADAELVELGQRFDALHALWREADKAEEEPAARRDAALDAARKRGGPTNEEIRTAWALPGVSEACAHTEGAYAALEPIMREIAATPTRSVQGLAIKARTLISALWPRCNYEQDATLGEGEDWAEQVARQLIEACCSAAGVDWRGQPQGAARAFAGFRDADAELIALGRAFDAAASTSGSYASGEDDEVSDIAGDEAEALARRIAALRAHTVEGMRVKLRVAAFYRACDPGFPAEEGYPGEAAIRSLYRDTPGIKITANPAEVRIVPEA